jgi:hypothetical protein
MSSTEHSDEYTVVCHACMLTWSLVFAIDYRSGDSASIAVQRPFAQGIVGVAAVIQDHSVVVL